MSQNTTITVTNVTADTVLTLKPKTFWELPSDVLTAVAPLLEAKAKSYESQYRAWQAANPNASRPPDDIYALWDLKSKCKQWAEKAERIPKKRIEDAAKAERAKAKANKAKDQKEHVRLVTPESVLIRESLEVCRKHIADSHFSRGKVTLAYWTKLLAEFIAANPSSEKTIDVGTKGEKYTYAVGKSYYDFSRQYKSDGGPREVLLLVKEENTFSHQTPVANRTLKAAHVAERTLRAEADQYAEFIIATYAYRVAERTVARHYAAVGKKYAKVTAAVSDNDQVWEGALITVSVGEHTYSFRTTCILNYSVYGKPFNQWPTREIASSHEDETTLEKWSN